MMIRHRWGPASVLSGVAFFVLLCQSSLGADTRSLSVAAGDKVTVASGDAVAITAPPKAGQGQAPVEKPAGQKQALVYVAPDVTAATTVTLAYTVDGQASPATITITPKAAGAGNAGGVGGAPSLPNQAQPATTGDAQKPGAPADGELSKNPIEP